LIVLPTYTKAEKSRFVGFGEKILDGWDQLNIPVRSDRDKYQFVLCDQESTLLVTT
jgi:hypothetical protein